MSEINFAAPLEETPEQYQEMSEAPPPALLDLEGVKRALAPYHQQIQELIIEAGILKVSDEASNTRAVELGNIARKTKKLIEAIKQDRPYVEAKAFVNGVGNLIKSFTDPLDGQVERVLKAKISAYQTEVRLEQQRREAAAREEARKLQEKIEAEQRAIREAAEKKAREAAEALKKEKDEAARAALQKTIEEEMAAANAPTPQVVAPVIPEPEKVTRTGAGSAWQRKRWVCRVVNPDEVPRQYCAPVQTLLNEAVKAGVRNIAGCVIEEIAETSFRG